MGTSWSLQKYLLMSRYRMTVHARDLDQPGSGWVKMPDLLDLRMWQGCVVTQVGDNKGILVIGGR